MKKLWMSLFLIPAATYVMRAQQVPDSISQRFKTDYPNVTNPTWRWEDNNYRVNYWDETNTEHNLIYDKAGRLSKSQYQVGADQVPPELMNYYNKNYPDRKDYKVWLEQDNTGKKTYYVPGNNETLYFDQMGNYSGREKGPQNNDQQNNNSEDRNKKKSNKNNSNSKQSKNNAAKNTHHDTGKK
ncbi:MAG: PepSY-like domain-containing protein [Bacteroidia bacterium]